MQRICVHNWIPVTCKYFDWFQFYSGNWCRAGTKAEKKVAVSGPWRAEVGWTVLMHCYHGSLIPETLQKPAGPATRRLSCFLLLLVHVSAGSAPISRLAAIEISLGGPLSSCSGFGPQCMHMDVVDLQKTDLWPPSQQRHIAIRPNASVFCSVCIKTPYNLHIAIILGPSLHLYSQ